MSPTLKREFNLSASSRSSAALWRCPVCGTGITGKAAELSFGVGTESELSIFRCDCGILYSQYAVSASPPDIYNVSYYEHLRYTSESARQDYTTHLLEFLMRFSPVQREAPLRLLDVGCATGDFVKSALQNGFAAEGMDISQDAVKVGQENGLPLRQGDIFDVGGQTSSLYDIITLWDVLEHLPDPAQALEIIRNRLSPGGMLFLKTVSSTSFIETFCRGLYRISFRQISAPLRRIYVPGHLFYYTNNALCLQLKQAKFDDVQIVSSDTPASALFSSPVMKMVYQGISDLQVFFNRGYELFAVATKGSG